MSLACTADSFGLDAEESVKEANADDLLCEAVQKEASVIQLELQGSLEEGVKAAVDVCREVGRRRPCPIPLTRTERELKKLGAPPDFLSTPQKSRRGDRNVSNNNLCGIAPTRLLLIEYIDISNNPGFGKPCPSS